MTLGALIAAEMFGRTLPVLRLSPEAFTALSQAGHAVIGEGAITADGLAIALSPPAIANLDLTENDRAMLAGEKGKAVGQAMRIISAMAANQGPHAG